MVGLVVARCGMLVHTFVGVLEAHGSAATARATAALGDSFVGVTESVGNATARAAEAIGEGSINISIAIRDATSNLLGALGESGSDIAFTAGYAVSTVLKILAACIIGLILHSTKVCLNKFPCCQKARYETDGPDFVEIMDKSFVPALCLDESNSPPRTPLKQLRDVPPTVDELFSFDVSSYLQIKVIKVASPSPCLRTSAAIWSMPERSANVNGRPSAKVASL